jgi:hypothetical protein
MPNGTVKAKSVFISYSHEDKPWADMVNKKLVELKYSCFFAPESLRAGDDWEDKIQEHLDSSQHIVVLWSRHAKESDWVSRERFRFQALLSLLTTEHQQISRRMIYLLLDDTDCSMKRLQMITNIRDADGYAKSPGELDSAVWTAVIDKTVDAMTVSDDSYPVVLGVLAMTRRRFEYLYSNDVDDFARKLRDDVQPLLDQASMKVPDVKAWYGETPLAWHPYGKEMTIETMLENVRRRVNENLGGKKISWHVLGDGFYSDDMVAARRELGTVREGMSLFVVDLLSLFDPRENRRLNLLSELFEDDQSMILMISPFVPESYDKLMRLLEALANPFFNYFYDSKIRPKYAHCGVNICNEAEIRRVLRTTVGPHLERVTQSGPALLRMGGTGGGQ